MNYLFKQLILSFSLLFALTACEGLEYGSTNDSDTSTDSNTDGTITPDDDSSSSSDGTKGTVSFANFAISVEFETKSSDVNVSSFIVSIKNNDTSASVGEWTYSDMPESISLSSGNYTIEATNLKTFTEGSFDNPYYVGSQDFIIADGQTTVIEDMECLLTNASVKIEYSDVLKAQMSSYSSTVSKGDVSVELASDNIQKLYFLPGDITILFSGIRDGIEVSQTLAVTLEAKDECVVTISSVETGSGEFGITADATTNEVSKDIVITDDGVITDPDEPDDPTVDPDEPTVDPDEPTVDPDDPTVDETLPTITGVGFDIDEQINLIDPTSSTELDAIISAPNGIDELQVSITFSDPALEEVLYDAFGNPPVLDLVRPTADQRAFFESIGLLGSDSIEGDTEFTVSVGSFMFLLTEGISTFEVVLVDKKGNRVTKTMVINIIKN